MYPPTSHDYNPNNLPFPQSGGQTQLGESQTQHIISQCRQKPVIRSKDLELVEVGEELQHKCVH